MVSQELLDILRCPNCVREKDGLLDYYKESWLVCQHCGRKYPIRDGIPVMLIDEGDKWVHTRVEALLIPPPNECSYPTSSVEVVHTLWVFLWKNYRFYSPS